MKITIDPHSGFCFGVVFAIRAAEEELDRSGQLYCLGDIVHNGAEVERLRNKGLRVIGHEELKDLHDCKVLIRAHGEPPETYRIALQNNIELIDASCPVVLKLQNKIKLGFEQLKNADGQIVIYGKEHHAEVNGLLGQTSGKAIVIGGIEDIDKIDFSKKIRLYSQTTKSTGGFREIVSAIENRIKGTNVSLLVDFIPNDTICRQVSNRTPQLKKFAKEHDLILFVSDKKSSNGLFLFEECKSVNSKTYFICEPAELDVRWFADAESIGICGATSTPLWVMENIATAVMAMV
ncbi:MAG: 4-hydroxy-3-methylbut-2-enyl diphosphate reductase [Bacteroidota bacterium]